MALTKEELIRLIKQHKDKHGQPYEYINVSGGRVRLEKAEERSLWAMWMRLITKKPCAQLEFGFMS